MLSNGPARNATDFTNDSACFGRPQYLFYAVMLMGVIQMAVGLLNGGALVKMIPHPVMIGFCNGLALVIGLAQFHSFKKISDEDDSEAEPDEDSAGERFKRYGCFYAPGMEVYDVAPAATPAQRTRGCKTVVYVTFDEPKSVKPLYA